MALPATFVHTSFIIQFTLLLHLSSFTSSQSFIGVNYGLVADNLPAPEATAKLLQSTSIGKVRMYGADPAMIRALANTGIGIVIGATNGDIPALASDPNFATQWVNSNVLAYPDSKIIVITVGNEVMTAVDQSLVSLCLPAMQNVQNALNAASLGGKIKVSTVHSMAVLGSSDPPSSGVFNSGFSDSMRSLLKFHSANGSPFMINPYPFFAYQSDTRPETLAFCLFQPNAGRVDSGNGIKYMNMFDAQGSKRCGFFSWVDVDSKCQTCGAIIPELMATKSKLEDKLETSEDRRREAEDNNSRFKNYLIISWIVFFLALFWVKLGCHVMY